MDFIEHPPDTFWEQRFPLGPATPVRAVGAGGGSVVAAGAGLHTLRPDAKRIRSRELPLPPDSEVLAVAAEPWSPYRIAVSAGRHVGVYTGHRPYEPILALTASAPGFDATHLAWVRTDGEVKLCTRQRGGAVTLNSMSGTTAVLQMPRAAAVANDDDGVLAVASIAPEELASIWVLAPGAGEWDVRDTSWLVQGDDEGGNTDDGVHVAVRGAAAAYSMDDWSADVTWERDEDDTNHFSNVPAVFHGPIAFGGPDVLFGAYNVEGKVDVRRHVRGGGVTRIARFGVGDDWEGVPATVTSIAWDAERRVLWAASPELGLIELAAPA